MINSRKLEDLDPIARAVCLNQIEECKKEGIEIVISSTYRDYEQQNALYEIGRSLPGKIVTNARAGDSFHNFRVAWDAVPLKNGKAEWNQSDPLFQRMIDIGRKAGASCGYDWKTFKDPPHFQIDHGMSIVTARANFDKTGSIFRSA